MLHAVQSTNIRLRELSENMLQNLRNKLPPHTVVREPAPNFFVYVCPRESFDHVAVRRADWKVVITKLS